LTKGKFAIVDAADYERVNAYMWYAAGSARRPYACCRHNGKHLSMHRFLMNPPEWMVVDHIDGNGLNNRRSNLRVCTQGQNSYNSRPRGKSSQYKGVRRDKSRNRWVVYVRCNGHSHYVGRFRDEIEAARAYDRKAYELFGEYAWLNFPEELRGPGGQASWTPEEAEETAGDAERQNNGTVERWNGGTMEWCNDGMVEQWNRGWTTLGDTPSFQYSSISVFQHSTPHALTGTLQTSGVCRRLLIGRAQSLALARSGAEIRPLGSWIPASAGMTRSVLWFGRLLDPR
jgi:hypothetical protein